MQAFNVLFWIAVINQCTVFKKHSNETVIHLLVSCVQEVACVQWRASAGLHAGGHLPGVCEGRWARATEAFVWHLVVCAPVARALSVWSLGLRPAEPQRPSWPAAVVAASAAADDPWASSGTGAAVAPQVGSGVAGPHRWSFEWRGEAGPAGGLYIDWVLDGMFSRALVDTGSTISLVSRGMPPPAPDSQNHQVGPRQRHASPQRLGQEPSWKEGKPCKWLSGLQCQQYNHCCYRL